MKTSKIIMFSFVLLFSVSICGQQVGVANFGGSDVENDPFANFHQQFTPMMTNLFQLVSNNKDFIEYNIGSDIGSPYVSDEFLPGKVYYEDEHLGNYYYRFNAYNGEIELKATLLEEEQEKALVQDAKVKLETAQGTLQYLSVENKKGQIEESYLISVNETKQYSLFERIRIKYTEGKEAANSMVTAIPSRFTTYREYYYKVKDINPIVQIPKQKNKFIKHFVPKEKLNEIKKYLKSNEIDLENGKDLISLFNKIHEKE
ncbi:hypothetical protein EJ994_09295 [Maribacter sp. MJ134]|uniref:hypothetical protein n=1 Tax=Maribacter sp. MJ134 TaxID=2496865 RepID=UPI000F81EB05|nr:hypothetical protein [Maribacter sp. MJ134]AZQ58994.1 hypothetical protein EJ994_09295 [Maribacter sp. MJ134]